METGSGHGKVTNSDRIKWSHITAAFREWKTWGAIILFWANTVGVYGYVASTLYFRKKEVKKNDRGRNINISPSVDI